MRKSMMCAAACALVVSGVAAARKAPAPGNPAQIQKLLACRAIADSAQRLACFDSASSGIDKAIATRDLVVIDREGANAARRSLFGFSLPSFGGLLGGEEDAVKEIESTLTALAKNPEGGWTFKLADGSTWTQTDDVMLALAPRKGDKVKVKRRSLGSFTLQLNSQAGVRVKRIG
jgi:hypothetical protein